MPGIAAVLGTQLAAPILSGPQSAIGNVSGLVTNSLVPANIVPYEIGSLLFQMNMMGDEVFSRWMGLQGFDINNWGYAQYQLTQGQINQQGRLHISNVNLPGKLWSKAQQINKRWPSAIEANIFYNRELIDTNLYRFLLDVNTSGEKGLSAAYAGMRYEIPGPSDLIRFAVRDAFTPEIVTQFGYHKELPRAILPWMNKQGYGQNIGIQRPPGATFDDGGNAGGNASWFDMYWWSHWELPSMGQGYEMFFRLYEKSRYGASPYFDGNNGFDLGKLELLQKANDYPQYWRKRLQAIAYQPLTRVDTMRMRKDNVITKNEVYHSFRANGYNDRNANLLTEWVETKIRKIDPSKYINLTVKELTTWFENGYYSEILFRQALIQIGFTEPEAIDYIIVAKSRIKFNRLQKSLSWFKKGFYRGIFSELEVKQALRNAGIEPDVVDNIVGDWFYDRQVSKKQLSAEKNVDLYKRGLLSLNNLYTRLQNLQYEPIDINLLIQKANQEIEKARMDSIVKLSEKQQKIQEKVLKEISKDKEEKEKAIRKEEDKRLKAILDAFTDKNLIKYHKSKFISSNDVAYILNLRGWPRKAILNWINAYVDKEWSYTDLENINATEESPE